MDSITFKLPSISSCRLSSIGSIISSTAKSVGSTICSNSGTTLAFGAISSCLGLGYCVVKAAERALHQLNLQELKRTAAEDSARQARLEWVANLPKAQKEWLDSEEWTKFKLEHGKYITDRVLGLRGPLSGAYSTGPITSCLQERFGAKSMPEDDALVSMFATVDCHRAMNKRDEDGRLVNADKTDWPGWDGSNVDLWDRERGKDVWRLIWESARDENDERRQYERTYGDAITSRVGQATVARALGVIKEAKTRKEAMVAARQSGELGRHDALRTSCNGSVL